MPFLQLWYWKDRWKACLCGISINEENFLPDYTGFQGRSSAGQKSVKFHLPGFSELTNQACNCLLYTSYNWIEIQHAESEYYLECLKISIRERYIKFLWDVLLLGNAEDFKMLLSWYCRDKEKYISMKLSLPFKYKIWSWAVFPVCCRYVALFVLRPYIRYKRKVKMQKLKAWIVC